jgi:hypothetical protein
VTLSLLAKIGELVVAIDATQIYQIHHTADLPARQVEANLFSLELEQHSVPGWDLGELFAYGASDKAWIVVDARLGSNTRRFGLRVGACITVRRLPAVKLLPKRLYDARPGAISGAFSTEGISELPDSPSGVVIDLAHLLTPIEHESGLRIARENQRSAG